MHEMDVHRLHMIELTKPDGPLSVGGRSSSIRNPDWFTEVDGRRMATDMRAELHDRIVEATIGARRPAGRNGSSRRPAMLVVGPPGAGKSTLSDRHMIDDLVRIDADDIKRQLLLESCRDGTLESWLTPSAVIGLAQRGARFVPLEFASLVHQESVVIARRIRDEAAHLQTSLLFDTTLPTLAGAQAFSRSLRKPGHAIHLVDVEAPFPFLLQQVDERWRIGRERQLDGDLPDGQLGGRWISPDTVAEYFPDPTGPSTSSLVAAEFARTDTRVASFQRIWRDAEHPAGVHLDHADERATAPRYTAPTARDHQHRTRPDRGGGDVGR